MSYVFVKKSFTEDNVSGKTQNGKKLTWGVNAFASIEDVLEAGLGESEIVLLDSKNEIKLDGEESLGFVITGFDEKEDDGKVSLSAKNSVVVDGGEIIELEGFNDVKISGANVTDVYGGKYSSNETDDDSKYKYTAAISAGGKMTVEDGAAVGTVQGYSNVVIDGAKFETITGGSNSSSTEDTWSSSKTTSSSSDKTSAAGTVTITDVEAEDSSISGFSTAKIVDSIVGDIYGGNSDSKGKSVETESKFTVDSASTSSAAGKITVENSTTGDINGFSTVVVDASIVENVAGGKSTYKSSSSDESESAKSTQKDTYSFASVGKFTASESTIGDVTGFANVELKDVTAGANIVFGTVVEDEVSADYNKNFETSTVDFKTTVKTTTAYKTGGSFTASGVAGEETAISNFNKVTIADESVVGDISRETAAKIVETTVDDVVVAYDRQYNATGSVVVSGESVQAGNISGYANVTVSDEAKVVDIVSVTEGLVKDQLSSTIKYKYAKDDEGELTDTVNNISGSVSKTQTMKNVGSVKVAGEGTEVGVIKNYQNVTVGAGATVGGIESIKGVTVKETESYKTEGGKEPKVTVTLENAANYSNAGTINLTEVSLGDEAAITGFDNVKLTDVATTGTAISRDNSVKNVQKVTYTTGIENIDMSLESLEDKFEHYEALGDALVAQTSSFANEQKAAGSVVIKYNAKKADDLGNVAEFGDITNFQNITAAGIKDGDDVVMSIALGNLDSGMNGKYSVNETSSSDGAKNTTNSSSAASVGTVKLDTAVTVESISGYQNVTLKDVVVGEGGINAGFNMNSSAKENIKVSEADEDNEEVFTVKGSASSNETQKAAGSVNLVDTNVAGDIGGYAKVTAERKNSDEDVAGYSIGSVDRGSDTVTKITSSITTDKKDKIVETVKTEIQANASGNFTAFNYTVGDISNYGTVKLTNVNRDAEEGINIIGSGTSKVTAEDKNTWENGAAWLGEDDADVKTVAYEAITKAAGNVTISADKKAFEAAELEKGEKYVGTFVYGDIANYASVNLKGFEDKEHEYSIIANNITAGSTVTKYDADDEAYKTDFMAQGKLTADTNVSIAGSISGFDTVVLKNGVGVVGSVTGGNFKNVALDEDNNVDWEVPADEIIAAGSLTMEAASVVGEVAWFDKVTMNNAYIGTVNSVNNLTVAKDVNSIGSYTGSDKAETLTINKGAVLNLGGADFGKGNDKLVVNGTLVLVGDEASLAVKNISGSGEIAAAHDVREELDIEFDKVLDLGATAEGFRGSAYEASDDTAKKAVAIDIYDGYTGWLGVNSEELDYKLGCDDAVDYVKFNIEEKGTTVAINGLDDADVVFSFDGDSKLTLEEVTERLSDLGEGSYVLGITKKDADSVSYSIGIELA
ncbi:MAG: hypothetical protein E7039_10485 [Lentisphaerae bacterium]|nr:hypothetical protein [Lentisphaerota bacterium]